MMKSIIICSILCVAATQVAWAQRNVKTINDNWEFKKPQEQQWKSVNLPHTYNLDAYQVKNYYQGKGMYRRILNLPEIQTDRRYFLKIDAVSKAATVWVNGKEVGNHAGGYTACTFDITDCVQKENTIEVTVDNSCQDIAPISADFTFMGGIYRNVKLITTALQHFSMTEDGADGVFVSVKNVSDNQADVSVKSRLRNDEDRDKNCELVNTLYAPDGSVVSVSRKKVRLLAGQTCNVQTPLKKVKNPVLWSPEYPCLYQVKTELLDVDKTQGKSKNVLDSQVHSIGMKWCEFDAQKGFFLNGKPYKLNGMCRHQDQRPYGVALDDDMHRRDLRLMKDMGCNFVRLAHYPQAEVVLEMCDKLGMLVWEEVPVVNYVPDNVAFADNACVQLREMIRQHFNHPSVILWGYMNEILLKARNEFPLQADFSQEINRINQLADRMEKIVHEEDPTRHSTMALHGSNDYHMYHVADHSQVLGWNLYQGWYGGNLTDFERYLAEQQQKYPTRPVIVSEWGAGSDLRLHSDQGTAFDFSCEYQQKYIEHYLPVISDTPYILGGSYWNFIDFSSASRAESMPHINNKGILTPERQKKDVYYYFQAAWRKDIPVVHIATRDWKNRNRVEKHQQVKVYTNAKEVTLWQNGKLLATQSVNNHFALFGVEWQEGENRLEAQAHFAEKTIGDSLDKAIDQTVVTYHAVPTDARLLHDIAINVGSHCYFVSDKSGMTWVADRAYQPGSWGYIGGNASATQAEVLGTADGPLFQTMLKGIEEYRFDVPEGRYELELLFVDTRQKQAQSVYLLGKDAEQETATGKGEGFDVEVNGKVIESNFMPGVESGYFRAIRRSYEIHAGREGVNVKFLSKSGIPFLSGIRLRKL